MRIPTRVRMPATRTSSQPEHLYLDEPSSYIQSTSDELKFALMTRIDPYAPKSTRKNVRTEMHPTLGLLDWLDLAREQYADRDIWVSQAEFFGFQRKVKYLARIAVLFSDLDTYSPSATEIQRGTPEEETAQALAWCKKVGIPTPSTIIFSGQGLQLKWLLTKGLPQAALGRWTKIQKEFQRRLAPLGADPKAVDPTRVLRLVGSINQKTGQLVRETYVSGIRYDFNKLASEFQSFNELPEINLDVDDVGNVRNLNNIPVVKNEALPTFIKEQKKPAYTGPRNIDGLSKFSSARLAEDRLDDLITLAKIRNSDGQIQDGQRDVFVFLASVFLVQAHVDQNIIQAKLKTLTKIFVPHWSDEKVKQSVSAAMIRLRAAINGESVTFNGQEVDPRYKFRNTTLISENWLNITAEEQSTLKTIIGDDEKKYRDRKRAQSKRKKNGQQTIDQYLNSKEERRTWALELKEAGATWSDIAELVGYKNAEAARKSCTVKKEKNPIEGSALAPAAAPPLMCTDAKTPPLKHHEDRSALGEKRRSETMTEPLRERSFNKENRRAA